MATTPGTVVSISEKGRLLHLEVTGESRVDPGPISPSGRYAVLLRNGNVGKASLVDIVDLFEGRVLETLSFPSAIECWFRTDEQLCVLVRRELQFQLRSLPDGGLIDARCFPNERYHSYSLSRDSSRLLVVSSVIQEGTPDSFIWRWIDTDHLSVVRRVESRDIGTGWEVPFLSPDGAEVALTSVEDEGGVLLTYDAVQDTRHRWSYGVAANAFIQWAGPDQIRAWRDSSMEKTSSYVEVSRDGIVERHTVPEVWAWKRVLRDGRIAFGGFDPRAVANPFHLYDPSTRTSEHCAPFSHIVSWLKTRDGRRRRPSEENGRWPGVNVRFCGDLLGVAARLDRERWCYAFATLSGRQCSEVRAVDTGGANLRVLRRAPSGVVVLRTAPLRYTYVRPAQ